MTDFTKEILTLALKKNLKIATAESCTGGLIAAALTDLAGSSGAFDRGFVTYSNAAKIEMLGVDPGTLDQFGAVSPEVALEMAEGALRNSDAAVALSVTGIAGPGGSQFKPEGRVCFGIITKQTGGRVETIEFWVREWQRARRECERRGDEGHCAQRHKRSTKGRSGGE